MVEGWEGGKGGERHLKRRRCGWRGSFVAQAGLVCAVGPCAVGAVANLSHCVWLEYLPSLRAFPGLCVVAAALLGGMG